MRSHIAGMIDLDSELIDRKLLRFMGSAAGFAYLSMAAAIADAGVSPSSSLTLAPVSLLAQVARPQPAK